MKIHNCISSNNKENMSQIVDNILPYIHISRNILKTRIYHIQENIKRRSNIFCFYLSQWVISQRESYKMKVATKLLFF